MARQALRTKLELGSLKPYGAAPKRAVSSDSAAARGKLELPVARTSVDFTRQHSYELLVEHASSFYGNRQVQTHEAKQPLTLKVVKDLQKLAMPKGLDISGLGIYVVRGPGWRRDDEDGGAGKPGKVLAVDRRAGTVTVHWLQTGLVKGHYRLPEDGGGRKSPACCELCLAGGGQDIGVDGPEWISNRRSSQADFAERQQTVIILDWDDTLFPSTYVRADLRFSLKHSLAEQNLSWQMKREVAGSLLRVAEEVEQLLRVAKSLGQVIIVTLAREPWVTDSCKFFYPGIEKVLQELDIKIVYAQQFNRRDPDKMKMMSTEQTELHWARVKGEAIGAAVKQFYSRYEGQSWKNIISIGDSDFERLGTMHATEEYMKRRGILDEDSPPALSSARGRSSPQLAARGSPAGSNNALGEAHIQGHHYRVRTKTFKMLDEPTVEELAVELSLMREWLPLMVQLDDGFDAEFGSLNDKASIRAIEDALRPGAAVESCASSASRLLESEPSASRWSARDLFARYLK